MKVVQKDRPWQNGSDWPPQTITEQYILEAHDSQGPHDDVLHGQPEIRPAALLSQAPPAKLAEVAVSPFHTAMCKFHHLIASKCWLSIIHFFLLTWIFEDMFSKRIY